MKRQITRWGALAAACALLVLCGAARPCQAQSGQIQVLIDGNPLAFGGVPPQNIDGHVLVPMRGVFEALGARVDYNGDTQTIHAYSQSADIVLRIGSTQAFVNGAESDLSVPAETMDGSTMVPLRFVSEALGADVRWNDSLQTVFISTHPDFTNYPPPPYQDNQHVDFYGRVLGTDPNGGYIYVESPEGWVNRVHCDNPGSYYPGMTLHLGGIFGGGSLNISFLQPAAAPSGMVWFPVRTPGYPTDYSSYPQPGYHENQHLNFYGRVVGIDTGLGIVIVLGTNGFVNRVPYSNPGQFQPGQTVHLQATYTQGGIRPSALKAATPPAGTKWKPVRAPVVIPHPPVPAARPVPPVQFTAKPTGPGHAPAKSTLPRHAPAPPATPITEPAKPIGSNTEPAKPVVAPTAPAKPTTPRHHRGKSVNSASAPKPAAPAIIMKPAAEPTNSTEPKPAEKPVVRPEPKPVVKPEAKPVVRPEPKPVVRPEAKPVVKPVAPEAKPATEPAKTAAPAKKPDHTHKPAPKPTPAPAM